MSNAYQFVVFIHIFSAFIMFSLWFFELMLVIRSEAGGTSWQPVAKYTGPLQMICMLLVFISGFYMMHKTWGPQPWLVISVILLFSTIPLSIALSLIVKKRKKSGGEVESSPVSLVRSIYKVGTALVILTLMVFKNGDYSQTLLIVIAAYLVMLGLCFGAHRARKMT